MRTRTVVFATALLAGWVSVAGAQQTAGQQPAAGQQQSGEQAQTVNPWNLNLDNWVDFGVRGTSFSGDEARFDRYRDERTGPFLSHFRYTIDTGSRMATFGLDNPGYRDQRLFGRFSIPGKLRVSAEWNQVPLFLAIGADPTGAGGTRSPYAGAGSPVQTLPNNLVSQVQAASGAAQQALIASLYTPVGQANPFDTQSRRDTFNFAAQYTATNNLALNFNLSTARRGGDQPWSVTFGFGQAAEVATPVETRTTDLTAGAEWDNDRGMVRISYDGSWFKDYQESLTIDSPVRVADSATAGAAHARYALWPTNNSNTVTGAGAISLPAHSRLVATLSIGNWLQDTALLPMTINSAIAPITLPRQSTQGDIRRIMTNVSFSTRPARYLNVSARYRLYDFNDRTPDFVSSTIVEYDQAVEPGSDELVPAHFSNRYNTFEAEATITSLRAVSFGAGYRFNRVSYTDREVGLTNDNAFFAKVDSTSLGMVSLHGVYEHSRRRSPDFNAFALTDLPDSGEYAGLRRYDIADRDRDTFTGMVQVMPVSTFAISGSVTVARSNYPNQQIGTPDLPNGQADAFGLQNEKMQGYAISFDATPRDAITVGASYGYQSFSSLQQSRRVDVAPTVPPSGQQVDPNRDWTVSEDEKVHYISANVELVHLVPKTAFRFTYDYNRADSPYTYAVGAALSPASQLPAVLSRWHTAIFDFRYFIRRNLAAGLTYWYDHYTVNDYALGSQIADKVALPGIILVGYGYRPYTVNSVWGRVMYIF